MFFKEWYEVPEFMRNGIVSKYFRILQERKLSLIFKRIFDIILSSVLIVILSPIMLFIAALVVLSSPGGIFYCQERVTQYGRIFNLIKFRTMIPNADKSGNLLTTKNDPRVTKIGKFLRKLKLDELPQLFNIFKGDMSFVGTRPEVLKYVKMYDDSMLSTLLMPAGLTSLASIKFRHESELLSNSENIDDTYRNEILPQKMVYNLEYLTKFDIFLDIKLLFLTIIAVFKR